MFAKPLVLGSLVSAETTVAWLASFTRTRRWIPLRSRGLRWPRVNR